MHISIRIQTEPLEPELLGSARPARTDGAVAVFQGLVRGEEGSLPIEALEYQAYQPMAEREILRLVNDLARRYPCSSVEVLHRVGLIQTGEIAVLVRLTAPHRAEVFAFLNEFMHRFKQDVPIWKVRSVAAPPAANP